MLFNSIEFPIFFAVFLTAYWLLKTSIKGQNLLILIASYFFYGWWDTRFLTLIVISTAIDYACAIGITKGTISKEIRAKSSIFLIASSFLFLGINWNNAAETTNEAFSIAELFAPAKTNAYYLLGILGITILLNILYTIVERKKNQSRQKLFSIISITTNLSILAVFKYFNFFADSFSDAWESIVGQPLSFTTTHIILPVGISFYTFQTLSYTIDVFRGKLKPCDSFIDFAAYVSFFPQLVAGPIERASNLIPQFQKARSFEKDKIREGIWLVAWGFYKKLVIADNLAPIVNRIFASAESSHSELTGPNIAIGIYAFAVQIYCDFSGYTDIARGLSKILGFDLMLNFNLPYVSRSPSEFWQRWHISLSSWLRDYLYIPLGGNRGGTYVTCRNLMLTMTLGGLWHGASWNFVAWGIYQGSILIIYRLVSPDFDKRNYSFPTKLVQWVIMFQLTCLGWLLFRVQHLSSVPDMLLRICSNFSVDTSTREDMSSLFFYATPLICMQAWQLLSKNLTPVLDSNRFAKLNICLFILFSLLVLSSQGGTDFIYFAF